MKPTTFLLSLLVALPAIANPTPLPAADEACTCGGCAEYGSYWCGYTIHETNANAIYVCDNSGDFVVNNVCSTCTYINQVPYCT